MSVTSAKELKVVTMLLPSDVPRSHHANSEAAVAASIVTMHRVTGAFVDPSLESAFGAHVFSVSFPVHILLMAIILVLWPSNALARTDKLAYWFVSGMVYTVAPVGRVLIHR